MSEDNMLKRIELSPYSTGIETSRSDAKAEATFIEFANKERWDTLIEFCEINIFPFVKEFPKPNFAGLGGIIASLYYASKAYLETSKKDKYIACLKILYSLEPFKNAMDPHYERYVDSCSKEYQNLITTHDVKKLNDLEVSNVLKKKGWFS